MTTTDPLTHPCPTCGAILGYIARSGDAGTAGMPAMMLHVYAYPPRGIVERMASRRIVARILDGDVFCPYCCDWQQFGLPTPGSGNG